MIEVVLVGCTKTKREHPAEARDLYDESPLFRKRRRVARIRGDWWGILSAEHGLVRPENWLEPYDTYIGNVDSEAWAEKVLGVLLDDLARHDDPTVTIFAGKKYVDPLVPDLEAEGYEILDPLRGLRPGERMSKLDDMAKSSEQQTLVTDGGIDRHADGMNRWERSSSGTTRLSAKVPDDLKRDFRDACDHVDETMTDVIEELMAEFIVDHGPAHVGDTSGYYPEDKQYRELYEACLNVADDLKIYQRRHASRIAQTTQQVTKTDLSDALMPLRRRGYVALGAMPPDLHGEVAARWRHWHIKPPCADPAQWKYREGNR